jgi:hypothetical protein
MSAMDYLYYACHYAVSMWAVVLVPHTLFVMAKCAFRTGNYVVGRYELYTAFCVVFLAINGLPS